MRHASLLLLALLCGGAALAQGSKLVDPTRPPSQRVPEANRDEGAAVHGPQLQSVLISQGRRVAVISGKTVALGESYGEATVAAIEETSVQLRYRNGRRTLHLLPQVSKRERGTDARSAQGHLR